MGKYGNGKRPMPKRVARRHRILGMHEGGSSVAAIATKQHVTKQTVRNVLRRIENGLGLDDAPRTGRPRALTEKQVELAKKLIQDPDYGSLRKTNRALQARGIYVTFKTVANSVKNSNLRARKRRKKFLIRPENQRGRVQWCVDHLDDTMHQIRKRVCSDEKFFYMNPVSRWVWVDITKPPPVTYSSKCVFATVISFGF